MGPTMTALHRNMMQTNTAPTLPPTLPPGSGPHAPPVLHAHAPPALKHHAPPVQKWRALCLEALCGHVLQAPRSCHAHQALPLQRAPLVHRDPHGRLAHGPVPLGAKNHLMPPPMHCHRKTNQREHLTPPSPRPRLYPCSHPFRCLVRNPKGQQPRLRVPDTPLCCPGMHASPPAQQTPRQPKCLESHAHTFAPIATTTPHFTPYLHE